MTPALPVLAAPDLPGPIRELRKEFNGKNPDQVRKLIAKRYGPPHRDVGSGLSILQWDVHGGVLTFHPMSGAFFSPSKTRTVALIQTHNRVRENLFGSYEMTTNSNAQGMRIWTGNLKVDSATYAFKASAQGTNESHFFRENPEGTVKVYLSQGITQDTLLESLGEHARVGQLVFTSATGENSTSYAILSSAQTRHLLFASEQEMNFMLGKSWENFWK